MSFEIKLNSTPGQYLKKFDLIFLLITDMLKLEVLAQYKLTDTVY